MKNKSSSFWCNLSKQDRFMSGNLFFLYFVQGIFVIGIGSLLPMIKSEYGLSYQVGGLLLSAHNIGSLMTGILAGALSTILGYKQTLLYLNVFAYVGFLITLLTGNPALLIFALLLTGIGRGVVNYYNNQIINALSRGSSGPLNILHSFFAFGALLSPFMVLFCTRTNNSGWRTAIYIIIGMGILTMITSPFMQMDSVSPQSGSATARPEKPLAFLKLPQFRLTTAIMLCYLCIEASVMGWLVTYFIDSGASTAESAQILTALLWVVILIGRSLCVLIAGKIPPHTFLVATSIGTAAFLVLVILSTSLLPLLIGALGLGLCMAGMYGNTISNSTEIFKSYPFAMGIFVSITGIGSVLAPSAIGIIAGIFGIRTGLGILLLPAILLIGFTVLNYVRKSK